MPQNIAIYFSDTGGGHRSAAEAIESGLQILLNSAPEKPDVELIKETAAEKSHPLNRIFVNLYNYLLRHHQPLMKYYYWFLHIVKPDQSAIGYMCSGPYLRELAVQTRASVAVSVHPMLNHHMTHAMRDVAVSDNTRFIIVITDPNADLWRGWGCEDADIIVAPNSVVKDKLMAWGIKDEKIKVLGMPVHPDFLKPPTIPRSAFLSHLGLSPDLPTICINAGWAGGGNLLKIYEALNQSKRQLQVLFLCGHNRSLYEEAMAAAALSDIPTAVLPFHDCMSDLMSAVDLMVTKAGGLTTFQSVAKRLPIAFDELTEPMPQEKGTIDILVEQGLAHRLNNASDIVAIVEKINPTPNREQLPLPTKYSLDKTDAVFQIASLILANLRQPVYLKASAHSHNWQSTLDPVAARNTQS